MLEVKIFESVEKMLQIQVADLQTYLIYNFPDFLAHLNLIQVAWRFVSYLRELRRDVLYYVVVVAVGGSPRRFLMQHVNYSRLF